MELVELLEVLERDVSLAGSGAPLDPIVAHFGAGTEVDDLVHLPTELKLEPVRPVGVDLHFDWVHHPVVEAVRGKGQIRHRMVG